MHLIVLCQVVVATLAFGMGIGKWFPILLQPNGTLVGAPDFDMVTGGN